MLINCLTSSAVIFKKNIPLFYFLLIVNSIVFSQNIYRVNNSKGIDKVKFKLINNVIIIPVEVNNVKLNFLLDTGVSKPIVFNFLKASDSLNILNAEKIYIKGLGNNGVIEALKSSNNTFKIGDAVNNNQDFYVVFDSSINFAPKLGLPIHGIIGYDFFKDVIVAINYTKKQLKIYNPENYKQKTCKKCETFNLSFHNNKPYFNILTTINHKKIPVKLLIDSGSSDALWLFKNDSLGISNNNKYYEDFLGFGLSGSIHGKRSKIDNISIKSFSLKNPKVAFPDEKYIRVLRKIDGRNGSLGGEILKRFNVVINYKNATITLKKNSFFKEQFSYNKSGIDIEQSGIRLVTEYDSQYNDKLKNPTASSITVKAVFSKNKHYVIKPAFTIANIRKNSPADLIGLQKGDLIISINNKETKNYKLQQLTDMFFDDEGKKIKLKVERNGKPLTFIFYLKSPLK